MRVVVLCLLLVLSSCMPKIPESVLDADWCRNMEAARADADARGRRNLAAAMQKHDCAAKLVAAKSGSCAASTGLSKPAATR